MDSLPRQSLHVDAVRCTSNETWDRVMGACEAGCHCASTTAKVVQRRKAHGAVVVTVQCDGCGRSVTGDLKREHFPYYLDLPAWDGRRQDDWQSRQSVEARSWLEAKEVERQAALEALRADYAAFRRTPEWADLRRKVLTRARFFCEACGDGRAEHVHHLDYDSGLAPPLWLLRAVCHDCHARLHRAGDPWHRPHLPSRA